MKRREFISITKKDFVIADQSGDFYETRLKESERFERIQEEPQCQLLRVFPRFRLIQDDRGGVCESLRSLASRPTSVGTRISKFPRLRKICRSSRYPKWQSGRCCDDRGTQTKVRLGNFVHLK